GRAGLLPAGVWRCAARGPRPRHRGRRREPDAVSVRPRAVGARRSGAPGVGFRAWRRPRRTSTRCCSRSGGLPPPPGSAPPPSPGFAAQANAKPRIYNGDWEAFWEQEGRERVSWFEPFETLLEWNLPYAKWYLGGKLNLAYNCVDRHVENGLGDKVAYYWEGE